MEVSLKTGHLNRSLHGYHHHVHHIHLLLVLHEDVAEGAVEHGVDQVGQAQVEDEQVGHCPHLVVACHYHDDNDLYHDHDYHDHDYHDYQ